MTLGTKVGFVMLAAAAACGGSSYGGSSGTGGTAPDAGGTVTPTGNVTDGGSGSSYVLRIQNMAYSPENLTVPPGATIEVENDDNVPHSVTSESAPGTYTPGAVSGVSFDTGIFTGKASFSIPANAPDGTVVPYYCRVHTSTMVDPTKVQITVSAAAAPPAPTAPSTPTPAPTTPAPMPGY